MLFLTTPSDPLETIGLMWCASSSAKLLTQLGLSGHGVNWPLSTPKMGAFDEQPVNAIKLDKNNTGEKNL